MIFMEGGSKFLWLMSSLSEDSANGSRVLLKAAVLMDFSFLVRTFMGRSQWHGKRYHKPRRVVQSTTTSLPRQAYWCLETNHSSSETDFVQLE
jgi:hypothetical protein